MSKRTGYVSLIGKPNAGKSSLTNAILGTKLSIVTHKPQTTRKSVLGIYTDEENQMIFLDTPGILEVKYELHKTMMGYVASAVADADIVTLIVDVSRFTTLDEYFNLEFLEDLKKINKTRILVLNKIDLFEDVKKVLPIIEAFNDLKMFKEIIPMSASKTANIEAFLEAVKEYLPEGEFLYDPELLSTQNQRFFVSEIIREQIFKCYQDELPYSSEVVVTDFKERKNGKWFIQAEILVERQSQKGIIIGAKGEKLKFVAEKARHEIETHLQQPIYLEIFVKVRENWRSSEQFLRTLGYQ
jgi:GTP-binding protein Era